MSTFRLIVVFGVLCAVQTSVSASLVLLHDNGGPDWPDAYISDPTFPIAYGDDFTVAQPTKVTRVTWYGAYSGGDMLPDGQDHFSIRFYDFVAMDTPNPNPLADLVIPSVTRLPTSLTLANSAPVFTYQADFSEVGLLEGRHLISIVNDTTGQFEKWGWHLHSVASGGQVWSRFGGATTWHGPGGAELSFQIYAVPEPGVVSGVAVFGVMLIRRRGRARLRAAG